MESDKIITLIFCVIIGIAWALAGAIYLICIKKKYSVLTMGTVVKTDVSIGTVAGTPQSYFRVEVQYGDNQKVGDVITGSVGKKLMFLSKEKAEEALAKEFPVGKEIPVYCNSRKGNARLFPNTKLNITLGVSLIGIGIFFVVFGIILLFI